MLFNEINKKILAGYLGQSSGNKDNYLFPNLVVSVDSNKGFERDEFENLVHVVEDVMSSIVKDLDVSTLVMSMKLDDENECPDCGQSGEDCECEYEECCVEGECECGECECEEDYPDREMDPVEYNLAQMSELEDVEELIRELMHDEIDDHGGDELISLYNILDGIQLYKNTLRHRISKYVASDK